MTLASTLSTDEFYTDIPVGEILRRARIQHGLSISDAETHLHIRAQHLEALERSDFDSLPGQVYVIGFIRTYSEFLGLDSTRIIHVLKRQARGLGTPQSLNSHILPSDSRLPSISVLAAAMTVFLLLALVWIAYQNSYVGSDYVLPAVPEGVVGLETLSNLTPEGTAADKSASIISSLKSRILDDLVPDLAGVQPPLSSDGKNVSGLENREMESVASSKVSSTGVRIILLDDSWIELRAPDGSVAQARLYKKGESFTVDQPLTGVEGLKGGSRAYTMTVNNAAAVQIWVGDKVVPPLGSAGQVRRNVSLDMRTLKILMSP